MAERVITDCFFDLYGTLVDIHTDESALDAWEKLRSSILGYGEGCRLSAAQMRDCFFDGKARLQERFRDDPAWHIFNDPSLSPVLAYLLSQCGVLPLKSRIADTAWAFRPPRSTSACMTARKPSFQTSGEAAGGCGWSRTRSGCSHSLR